MNAKALLLGGLAALALAAAANAQPPRPDPLAALPAAVTMVMQEGLMLVENDHGVANARTLKIGEEYRDGWTLEAVTATSASFRKGREIRSVSFAQRAASAGAPQEEGAAAAGQVSLSNAVAGERPKPGTVDRAKVQAAITAGDIRGAYDLGGSASDIAQAIAARGGPMASILNSGGEASFVNANGRTGVRVSSSDDQGRTRMAVMVPPELADVAPPPDAPVLPPPPQAGSGDQVTVDANGNVQIRRGLTLPAPPQ